MSNILAVGDYLRVRIWTRLGAAGQAAVNTVNYYVSAVGGSPATDFDAATYIDAIIASLYKAVLSSAAEYRGVQAQILNGSSPYHAKYSEADVNASAGAGLVTGNLLPHQTAGLISWQTPLAGQANRGRFYVAFPGVGSDTGGGSPTSTYDTDITALAGALRNQLTVTASGRSATIYRVIMHGKNKAGSIPTPTPITSASVSSLWATQRRRGSFGRLNTSPI